MVISQKHLLEVPSKLEIQCKKGLHFSFYFGWYYFHLDIFRYEQGGLKGGGSLNGQNPLSVLFVDSP